MSFPLAFVLTKITFKWERESVETSFSEALDLWPSGILPNQQNSYLRGPYLTMSRLFQSYFWMNTLITSITFMYRA